MSNTRCGGNQVSLLFCSPPREDMAFLWSPYGCIICPLVACSGPAQSPGHGARGHGPEADLLLVHMPPLHPCLWVHLPPPPVLTLAQTWLWASGSPLSATSLTLS